MHEPVLLKEVLHFLNIKENGTYVDGTLGLGGHAEEIAKRLGEGGRLLGIDIDPTTLPIAESRLQPYGNMTITRQVNFRGLQRVLQDLGWDEVDGMIFDLGFSSAQLDDGARGLTFQKNGPLDMRLDPTRGETALSVLRTISEEALVGVLKKYGETRSAHRLTRHLLAGIASGELKTTHDLSELCERLLMRRGKIHPATRVFLALRSLVNKEEDNLRELLHQVPNLIRTKGRILIISFQSIEDGFVKQGFRRLEEMGMSGKRFRVITKKPITPSEGEITRNPRSRSAKLRVLERSI